ncbi:amidohydrolase family protein [Wenzhouxiangella marina]|uniref:2-amino-3-carboxymuconate-6-semialdehyde decarboxylase n=1 Tax=Wenzhouxiangella marina TaxID=1579979 RepID=A0A0K0XXT5_9GAMM|nr:amidohydrolase family protein [Wenzhouxiangella marina]AKS42493.1 2-amino-3-carboxymuconate-6-semialdehyde decarboxylase [Wenzhouxiangella marina]MBB6085732.1 aminocarboxymuconate-semialdehyde decarboxylase [Wenzhouxiangella marina]
MDPTLPIIDLHSHLLPEQLPAMDAPGFPRLEGNGERRNITIDGKFFRAVDRTAWDIEHRIEHYAQAGVGIQVVCTVPVLFSYHLPAGPASQFARALNDQIAEQQQRHPKHVIALGTLPLQDTELAINEAEHLAHDLGLPGVQIGSNINDRNLDDPELFEVFAACQDLGLSVLVHPWNMMGKEHMPDYWLPWLVGMPAELSRAICSMIFGGVLERLPDLRVCFAHGGGSFPFTIGRIEHGFNMRPDLVATRNPVNPRDYLGRFWVDSVTHDPKALAYLIEVMGEDRVTLGTDYPFPLGEQDPGSTIRALDPAPELREKLFWRNALEFLDLSPERFGLGE